MREREPGTGIYEFMIDPGTYILAITRMGFHERTEEIVAIQGENEFKIEMRSGENRPFSRERAPPLSQ